MTYSHLDHLLDLCHRTFQPAIQYSMNNLPYFLLIKLPRKVGSLLRNIFYYLVFSRRGVTIGKSAKIIGISHIELQGTFNAGNYLWLEALTSFAQDHFNPKLSIGPGFGCSDFVHIGCVNKITIGSGVLIGSKTLITDHSHGTYHGEDQCEPTLAPNLRRLYSKGPVNIGNNVFIGDNCVIQAGVTIGDGAIITANSVVSRSIPANTMASGAPAQPFKQFCEQTRCWISI